MATSIRIQLDSSGIRSFLKSDDVRENLCLPVANRIQGNAGEGYVVDSGIGFDRAYAVVRTDSLEAMRDNATNHTLLRALHSGGSW